MTDLMNRLTEHRPTDAELDQMWAPSRRAALRERLDAPVVRRRAPRRLLLAAAVLVVGVPVADQVVSPDAAQARADLTSLAATAAASDSPVLGPGQYLHVRTHSVQDNRWPVEDGRDYVNDREAWVGWDGSYWAVETRPGEEWRDYIHLGAHRQPSLGNPTPEFAETLPADAAAFRAYLEPRVSGSNSHEEALYEAVTGLIRSQYLPPDALAAALGALADVDGVHTEDVTVGGRDAVRISYRRFGIALISEDSVTVDRATARPVSEETRSVQSTYVADTTTLGVVAEVPAAVRAVFDRFPDGARLCADGAPPAVEDC